LRSVAASENQLFGVLYIRVGVIDLPISRI
jgi:hypothetical protein